MIDLMEGIFTACKISEIPNGYCAIIHDEECVYAGLIEQSPTPPTGSVILLGAEDFDNVREFMKKYKN